MTYIIKTDRALVCYYYREGRLLKRIRNEKGFSEEFKLITGIRPLFSLSLTEKREACIFCRDLKGNIILVKEGSEGITGRVLLKSKENNFKGNILFDAEIKENEIDLLFNTPSKKGSHNLYIQKLSSEPLPPQLIDTAYPLNNIIFRSVSVRPGLRLVFYLKRQGENKLGYREISEGTEGLYNCVFSSGVPFDDCSFAVSKGGIYFTAVTNTFFSSRLYFRARDEAGFTKVITAAETANITDSLVFTLNDRPVIFFKASGKPYIIYNLSDTKPFKCKICPELSRGRFIDMTSLSRIKASEVLVDLNKPWDVQIYPETDEGFYSFKNRFVKEGSEAL